MKQLAAIVLMVSLFVIAQGCMSAKLPGGVHVHGDSARVERVVSKKSEGMAGGVTNMYDAAADAARHGRRVHITGDTIDIEGAPPEPHRGLIINKTGEEIKVKITNSKGLDLKQFEMTEDGSYEVYLTPGEYTMSVVWLKAGSKRSPGAISLVVDNVKGDSPYKQKMYDFYHEII